MKTSEFMPRLVFWELTTGCNLRCIHCRASAQELASPLDLSTPDALRVIDDISSFSRPILVLSGGEPLFRKDIFEIASYATQKGLLVALATNGTLVTPKVAGKLKDAGVRRVAISLDGSRAGTHDSFRGIPGSFSKALRGLAAVQDAGISTQINTTVTKNNMHQLPQMYDLALGLGVEAFHIFLLVPVGCGVDIAEDQMVPADEYEKILHWFYEREQEGRMELKATCSPTYYRVRKQRQVLERRAVQSQMEAPHPRAIGADLKPRAALLSEGVPKSRHPQMGAVTKGCLAGSGVCFISHKGEVFPCGYLPVKAGDLKTQSFADVWENSDVFDALRNPDNLEGKCGICEYRMLCLGCRARAYAGEGNYLAEEPFCDYEPKAKEVRRRPTVPPAAGQAGRGSALNVLS
jgi:radical SAM protein with 4Fe4S-binding SPASM domain